MNTAAGGPVIDLGGGWREPLPEPGGPRRRLRVVALVLAAALPLALGGAAAPEMRLIELARVPVADALHTDMVFAGDVVLLRGQGGSRRTSWPTARPGGAWSCRTGPS
ncbi:hypothetical protein ACFQZ4_32520 [Catellatospora coxensis]